MDFLKIIEGHKWTILGSILHDAPRDDWPYSWKGIKGRCVRSIDIDLSIESSTNFTTSTLADIRQIDLFAIDDDSRQIDLGQISVGSAPPATEIASLTRAPRIIG